MKTKQLAEKLIELRDLKISKKCEVIEYVDYASRHAADIAKAYLELHVEYEKLKQGIEKTVGELQLQYEAALTKQAQEFMKRPQFRVEAENYRLKKQLNR